MEIVHQGFDGLDVAFAGAMPGGLLARLERAKDMANSTMEEEYCSLKGIDCWVKSTGSAGGYTYVLNTGPDGEIWFIKTNTDVTQYNLRVSVRAVQLALNGFEATVDRLYDTLRRWNCRVTEESVSRVDFALDVIAPDFKPNSMNIICHSHTGKKDHFDQEFFTDQFTRGNRVSTVTIGQMPGRQIQIYDKTREAKQTGKKYWFEIWGDAVNENDIVWRIECRAGKKHLQNWNIRTLDDLRQKIGTVFADDLERVRLITNPDAVNRGRDGALDPVWKLAQETIPQCLENCQNAAIYGRIVEGRRAEIQNMYIGQIKGLMAGLSVASGWTPDKAKEVLQYETHNMIEKYLGPDIRVFTSKYIKASKRLKFLDHEGGYFGEKSRNSSSEVSGMPEGNIVT